MSTEVDSYNSFFSTMSTFTKLTSSAFALALFIGVGTPVAQADNSQFLDAVTGPGFEQLAGAATAADLVGVLDGFESDITIFAPTNKAFENLPKVFTRAIENDADGTLLASILTYHVAPGALLAEDVVSERKIETVQGSKVTVRTPGKNVFIDRAKVVETDISVENAAESTVVVHRINKVLIPWKDRDFRMDLFDALRASH